MSLTPPSPLDHLPLHLRKDYCIPGSSGPHSCPHTLALFNTGLHSLNSKLNPPSGLLGMTDVVNIVESVCQDPGRPALPEQETHSQNIVLRWKMRPGTTVAQDGCMGSEYPRSDTSFTSLWCYMLLSDEGKARLPWTQLDHRETFQGRQWSLEENKHSKLGGLSATAGRITRHFIL